MYTPSHAVTVANRIVTLLLAGALVFAIYGVVSIGVGIARDGDSLLYPSPMHLPFELSPDDVNDLPPGVELSDWPKVTVDVGDPTTWQMLLRSVEELAPLLLLIPGLWLLRNFLRSVLAGDPFGAANTRRLRAIALLLLVGAPLVGLVQVALRNALFDGRYDALHLGTKGYALPGSALLGGLAVYILAEVFAYGVRLREDVEATV
jgi:hypothetical protein